jgi:uncharacterized protein YjbJ (UPF0337 family)
VLNLSQRPAGRAFPGGRKMTWYQIANDWQQFTAMVKQEWDKLTDDDLTTFGGQSDQLAGILQRKYGYAREQAEKEITEFSDKKR